jgi:hypothetical protein
MSSLYCVLCHAILYWYCPVPEPGTGNERAAIFLLYIPIRSFIVSGGSAVYVAAYSLFYFMTKLEIDEFVPTLLYFSYTLIMVITFW